MRSIEVANSLGECVLWRDSDATAWWTDIFDRRLYRLDWASQQVTSWETPSRLGCFGFIEGDNDRLLVAFEEGFAVFEPTSADVRWLDKPTGLRPGVRMNDGRVDPAGRFWAGSMNEQDPQADRCGCLYRLDSSGKATSLVDGIGISNAICWSPDAATMYYADTARGLVYCADYDVEQGQPSEFRPFIEISDGAPDGAVTDENANLWIAIWGGSRVDCWSPGGEWLDSIDVPALQPTCPAFGGPDNNLLFVTSATVWLSEAELQKSPSSGALFVYETDIRGIGTHCSRKPFTSSQ